MRNYCLLQRIRGGDLRTLLKSHLPSLFALLPLFAVIFSVSVLIRQRDISGQHWTTEGCPSLEKKSLFPSPLPLTPHTIHFSSSTGPRGLGKSPGAAAGQGAGMQERRGHIGRLLLPLRGVGYTRPASTLLGRLAGWRLQPVIFIHTQHSMDCSLCNSLLSSHQEAYSHCPALRACPFHRPLP